MPLKEDFNKRIKLLIVLALFLILNIIALFVYFAIPENAEIETGIIKNIETPASLDESNLINSNNDADDLAANSFAKVLGTSSSSVSSSHSSSKSSSSSPNGNSCAGSCGIGSPDEECKDFGFDFGVAKWECEGSCCNGGSWKLDEESYPGTSVTGCCSNATWDTGSSGADGVIVKAGNIEHGGYYYTVNGTSGIVILSKDISHITFCGYEDKEECGNDIIEEGEECEHDSDCEESVCNDKCIGNDYYEYKVTENDCNECSCEDNECEIKNISYNDTRCLEPKCGDGKVDAGEECDDGNTINEDECSNNCEINECIIKLNKTESIDPIKAGEELSYYIEVTNIGTGRCTGGGVQLKEYYDSNTIFLSSNPSPTSNNNLWNFGILDPGEKEEITINMQVNETAQCGEILINKICIWANELSDWQCITEQTSIDCPAECGDGNLDAGEECDDGNFDNLDECRNDCTLPYCGDLILDFNEECEINNQCPEKCTKDSHKLYTEVNCDACECDYSKYKCIIGKCGAVCDSNDDCQCEQDYCNGTTRYDYPENSTCGTSGSESCLCTACTANVVYNSTECGYQEPKCGDGIINQIWEECDDGNNVNGDGCDSNCKWEIICDDNSDCGKDGWINEDYCVCTTNVWDFWESFECKNPGTKDSYCTNKTEAKLKQECGSDSCIGWENFCKNDDAWKKQTCYDVGCALGACFNHTIVNETLVQDCGEDSCDEPVLYCKDNDVWKNQTCYDKGCSLGGCFNNPFTNKSKSKECGENSYGEWNNYCIGKEVWKNKTDVLRGCKEGGCYEEDDYKNEKVETCLHGCENGECTDECCDDGDCPSDSYSNKYCYNQDVYWNLTDYFCKDGDCLFNMSKIIVKDCGEDSYSEALYCYNDDVWKNISETLRGCEQGNCFADDDSHTEKKEECGSDYCDNWGNYYCDGKNKVRERTCYDKGCSNSGCFSNPDTEKQTEECAYDCVNGECAEPCGDGNLDSGEECDLGSNNGKECTPGYGETCTYCSATCENKTITDGYCGDEIVQAGYEECEFDYQCNDYCIFSLCLGTLPNKCVNCRCEKIEPKCGNGIKEDGEECDDGNNVNGDGCDEDCKKEGCPCCIYFPFQFCIPFLCGDSCYNFDFPDCKEISGDCITAII